MKREYLALGAVLAGVLIVSYLLPLGLFQSGLLVVATLLATVIVFVPGVWSTLYRKTGVGPGGWLLAAVVAGGGIALSYLVGDPQPFCEGIQPYRGCLTLYGWASAIFLASSLGVAISAGHLGRYRRLRNASVVPVDDVSKGLVAVEGRVVPAGTAVPGPVSGKQTVWYRTVLETATLFKGYREIDDETANHEFFVEDGSGRLLVLPDHLDEHDVAELARSHTEDTDGQRRREWSFEPNDVVTVVGYASEVSRAEYPEPAVVGLDGPVIVGLRTLTELRTWVARRAVLGGVITLIVGGISLLAMLGTV